MKIPACIFFMLLLVSTITLKAQRKKRNYYLPGDYVANFSLQNIDGRHIALDNYLNQTGVIIVFMRNTCEYCQAYEGRIKELAKKYTPKHIPLIAISPFGDDKEDYPQDDLSHMKRLAQKEKFTFPYLTDEKFRITTLFNDQYTPSAYVLQNINGKFKLLYGGDIDNDWQNSNPRAKHYVQHSVDSLLVHVKPPLTSKQL